MKRLLNILQIPLILTGFNALSESVNMWHGIRRAFFYISGLILIYSFTHNIVIKSNINRSDQIFLFIADVDFLTIMVQSIFFGSVKQRFLH